MKRIFIIALISVLGALSVVPPAAAYDMGDSNLIIPIAARAAGAFGSQWRTDLIITNLEAEPVNLFITFHTGPTSGSFTDKIVPGLGTLVLEDVLKQTLLVDSGSGMIRVNSATPGARFTARAYLYNRGNPAGEFGQGVPAVPVDALGQEHVLSGVTGFGGRRSNVGVSNPWSTETDVLLMLHDGAGEMIGAQAMTVDAETVVQLNDVFAAFQTAPRGDASVRILSSLPVFPYLSVVRNDTGDAVWSGGSGIARTPGVLTPRCSEPAPMIHPYRGEEAADQSVIQFRPGTSRQAIDQIAAWHQFAVSNYFDDVPAVEAMLTPETIATVRCEPAVMVLRRDGAVGDEF